MLDQHVFGVGHDQVVPDDLDYEWFGWLVANPGEWTPADLEVAEAILINQRRTVEDAHPRDARGRERLQAVVTELQQAIDQHRRR
jgi:hypothetical protein